MKQSSRSRLLLYPAIILFLSFGGRAVSFSAPPPAEAAAAPATPVLGQESSTGPDRVPDGKRLRTNPLDVRLDYVRSARVDETVIFGFPNKTLVIEFKAPMRIVSTLEGERKGILSAGNHYVPPPCWDILHRLGLDASRGRIYKAIGKSREKSCFLFTGADMGNLSVQSAHFKEMAVIALVTAGVVGNALRMSVDEGSFYEPGTINVILMTNMRLTPRAMTRAIVTATEAKTAALQDLDVRSSASPLKNQATGTGTDEMLVVEGLGRPIDNTGGHSKMGELIAKAVYEGVKEAVYRQNGIEGGRSLCKRLRERRIDLPELIGRCAYSGHGKNNLPEPEQLEEILVHPRYASFMEAALALSDAHERGLAKELEPFQAWCRSISEEIAGSRMEKWPDPITSETIPVVLRMSLNALLNGLICRE
jgi:adenosylcobinamide amidohydrolase